MNNNTKLVLGAKYVPHAKTVARYGSLSSSTVWACAMKDGQPFLYYTGLDEDGNYCFDHSPYDGKEPNGDFFMPEDVTPYVESTRKPKEYACIYDRIYDACELEVGDLVEVTHRVPSYDLGWNNNWISEMTEQVGKQYVISHMTNEGVALRLEDGSLSFSFPVHTLKFISKSKPEFKEVRISSDYLAKVFHDRIEVGCQKITMARFNELVEAVKEMSE